MKCEIFNDFNLLFSSCGLSLISLVLPKKSLRQNYPASQEFDISFIYYNFGLDRLRYEARF